MEAVAYFSDIHNVILKHLHQARLEIQVAVAWFTDQELFDVLCKKAAMGLSVQVALVDDDINKGPRGLNFARLADLGGQVTFISPGSRGESLMHHKFCIIDAHTIITGSYNWSRRARSNDENITVISGAPDLARQYLDAFQRLVFRSLEDKPPIDSEVIHRRLELIRNFILLGEYESIGTHVEKLRSAAENPELQSILDLLDTGEYTKALEKIQNRLQKGRSLVQADAMEIMILRLELQVLELRLESLHEKKAELERRLVLFNRRHDEALGDLIQKVLKARAELARLRAAQTRDRRDKAAAEEAEARYREYAKQQKSLRDSPPPRSLNADKERELKRLFRKACKLCHPDKVADPYKASAKETFQELQQAYQANDLDRVREIYEMLQSGGALPGRLKTLREVDALRAAVAEMKRKIEIAVREYKALEASDAVRLMESIGTDEAAWESYVARRRAELQRELDALKREIAFCRESQSEDELPF